MVTARILCLEDDNDTCEITGRILGPKGYEVVAAGTIAEALQQIEADGFSLYIIDGKLPDGEGVDFIRKVRQSGSMIPILVHSAAAFSKDVEKASQAGADEYLIKPNGWRTLVETVEKLLSQDYSSGGSSC